MLHQTDGAPRRRLTEPAELALAAEFLLVRGFAEDEIAVQLSRFYYIDIDTLNDVVASLTMERQGAMKRQVAKGLMA